jgi:hypothetical protein
MRDRWQAEFGDRLLQYLNAEVGLKRVCTRQRVTLRTTESIDATRDKHPFLADTKVILARPPTLRGDIWLGMIPFDHGGFFLGAQRHAAARRTSVMLSGACGFLAFTWPR